MEDTTFNSENLINLSIDFKKLSGTLNLLYQHNRTNSANIEVLQKSFIDLSSSSQFTSNTLSLIKTTFEAFDQFQQSSIQKQKNLETQIKSLEESFAASLKSLEKKLPDLSTQINSEIDKLKSDQKNLVQEIKSKIERNSKPSILQSVELSRVETDLQHDLNFHRQNSEVYEGLNARVEQIETSLKRVSFEEIFDNIDDSAFQKIRRKSIEEKNDLIMELNLKYMMVISEVAKLREMMRAVANLDEEKPVDLNVNYLTFNKRIGNMEDQMRMMLEKVKESEKELKVQTPNPLSKKRKSLTELGIRKTTEKTISNPDLLTKLNELKSLIQEKVSFYDLSLFVKDQIEQVIGPKQNLVSQLESQIFKEIDHRSELSNTDLARSVIIEASEKSYEFKSMNEEQNTLKDLLKTVHESLDKQHLLTTSELERLSNEIKTFDAKINKLTTAIQVQDIRTQDQAKRVQVLEDFKQEANDQIEKLVDRFKKTSMKSSEELEKTMTQLQEMEKIRSNVQEIIQKLQEGSKLHKRDYETIQELKSVLESKLSKEEIEQKVDKNDLKKMFRNLSKRVTASQIERIQTDIKTIEENGVNESIKKCEEPLITTRRLSSECLACGKDLTSQNKSVSKLPAHYKVIETQQLPGFSKILPVLSNTFENSRRLKTERFSINVQDSEFLPSLGSGRGVRN